MHQKPVIQQICSQFLELTVGLRWILSRKRYHVLNFQFSICKELLLICVNAKKLLHWLNFSAQGKLVNVNFRENQHEGRKAPKRGKIQCFRKMEKNTIIPYTDTQTSNSDSFCVFELYYSYVLPL